jgi:hypothetical protein
VACARDVSTVKLYQTRADAYAAIAKARREADAYYFGLDVRFDTGDPTGDVVIGDKGTHFLGGLAGGVRIPQGKLWDWELRGRGAFDYFRSRDVAAGPDPLPVNSFDWGLALIFSGRMKEEAKHRLALGAGLEGRHAKGKGPEVDLAPTNYANVNLMVVVPAIDGGDLGLAVKIPVRDSTVRRGASVVFSADLGLLDSSGP